MSQDPYRHFDAAYLLGALGEDDRIAFEAHLPSCPDCRSSLGRARSAMPYLIASEEDALDGEAPFPDTILPRLLAQARRSGRRRRAILAAVGVAVASLIVAIGIATIVLNGTGRPEPQTHPMVALRSSPITATASLSSTAWGTDITLDCRYTQGGTEPPGYRYALAVRSRDGTISQLGTWQLNDSRPITFKAGTALPMNQIRSIEVTDSNGTPILRLMPPAHGAG